MRRTFLCINKIEVNNLFLKGGGGICYDTDDCNYEVISQTVSRILPCGIDFLINAGKL